MLRYAAFIFGIALFTACTAPYVVPPNPPAGGVTLSPASLSFTAVGATDALPVSASQANYFGTFTSASTTCTGIATIASTGAAAFSVTPVAVGTCSFTITGGGEENATLNITVTTTTVGGH